MRRNSLFRSLLLDMNGLVQDIDGNIYDVVRIGSQEWITENLKVTKYSDGSSIRNIINTGVTDWYEPSRDELMALFNELYLYGVGGFQGFIYRSSTEGDDVGAFGWNFGANLGGNYYKYLQYHTRPIRNFNSTTVYSLRDIGPSGGWIFHIIDLGGGDFTYYEAAPVDTAVAVYSNIDDTEIGVTAQGTAIGTGQANTIAIIGQAGHTTSGAKLCDDYSYGWADDSEGAFCFYDNDVDNKPVYGALYNWAAVTNAKNIVRITRDGVLDTNWRVPSLADFESLAETIGGLSTGGGKIKEEGLEHWNSPNTDATDYFGFSLRGAGARSTSSFTALGTAGYLFSSSSPGDIAESAWTFFAFHNSGIAYIAQSSKKVGLSLRLVRDVS